MHIEEDACSVATQMRASLTVFISPVGVKCLQMHRAMLQVHQSAEVGVVKESVVGNWCERVNSSVAVEETL